MIDFVSLLLVSDKMRYKNVTLMSRMQKTDGTNCGFAQTENIKRQAL